MGLAERQVLQQVLHNKMEIWGEQMWQSHAGHMQYRSHAGHMQATCRLHAGHMQVTCRSHAGPVACIVRVINKQREGRICD